MPIIVVMLALVPLLVCLGASPQAGQSPAGQPPAPPAVEIDRLRRYQDRLASVASRLPMRPPLVELVRRVMPQADDTGMAGHAIADENRAALIALAFYVNGWPLEALVPEARTWPRLPRKVVVLRGRHDLAQHFTVSAVIAAFAGTPIANMAGLYKEMNDARGLSGFSFSDIAGDRSGTTFGEMATRSVESATRLQSRLVAALAEDDLMPATAGLPDNLSQAEFARRFGSVGSPAYNDLAREIERRVAALPLFR